MLRKAIEDALDKILVQYNDGTMTETEVLSTINKAVYYNHWHTGYIWELFFIQALKQDMVPDNLTFVLQLFRDEDMDSFIHPDKIDRHNMQKALDDDEYFEGVIFKGTRLKVLEHLKLDKSILAYKQWLCQAGTLEQVRSSLLGFEE